jgi:putative SOS response-associated peptidase YedK
MLALPMPPLPGIFPDYTTPIVRNSADGRELAMARWGMPVPAFALKGRNSDPGVTNVRTVAITALEPLARCGEPVRGAVHQLFGK